MTPAMRNHSLNFQSYARPRRDIQPSKPKGVNGDDDDDDDDDKDYDDDNDDDDDADDDHANDDIMMMNACAHVLIDESARHAFFVWHLGPKRTYSRHKSNAKSCNRWRTCLEIKLR